MTSDLTELLERIDGCEQMIRNVVEEANKESRLSVVIQQELFRPGMGAVYGTLQQHPSVKLRQAVGLIVHEQRSVLDGLACQLAWRNGANEVSDVYFPITSSKSTFENATARRKIRQLSSSDRDKIALLKPWPPEETDVEDGNLTLCMLHEADRIHKHRKLLGWACIGGVSPAGSGTIGSMQSSPVIFTEVGKKENLAVFRDMTCSLSTSVNLVYSQSEMLYGNDVIYYLREFNRVVSEILQTFADI